MATPTVEQLQARIRELEAENDKPLTCKIGEKGGVSVYGLGRFPVTLYYEQWQKLFANTDRIQSFLQANKPHLKIKDRA